jgi:hypothetical protein
MPANELEGVMLWGTGIGDLGVPAPQSEFFLSTDPNHIWPIGLKSRESGKIDSSQYPQLAPLRVGEDGTRARLID